MTTDEGQPPQPEVETLHLQVHPTVVFKLGADLVTDDVQALIELVKNSYDADSPDARITVDTEIWTDPLTGDEVTEPATPDMTAVNEEPRSSGAGTEPAAPGPQGEDGGGLSEPTASPGLPVRGLIRIQDRGVGMTASEIARGWLVVSASHKREMKRLGQVTSKRQRTPLGDKGLGRLGAQRLGDILEIETVPQDARVAHRLKIRWSDFDHAISLSNVDLHLETFPTTAKPGTTLTVRGLRDPERWQGENVQALTRELAAMISPFGKRGFDVGVRVDGEPIDLRRRHEQVRDSALLRYRLKYQQGELSIEGFISTSYFRPRSLSEVPIYHELVERDNGASFRDWLIATAPKEVAALKMGASDDKYFLRVKRTLKLADLDDVKLAPLAKPSSSISPAPVDPGPFSGEVDAVALALPGESSVFDSSSDYRAFVSAINGVRVYRDGFAVRVDSDWMGLAARWSSGTSFYNLRPENVVGYIDISARDNPQLEELTNREGFQDTAAFQNFMLLVRAWRSFTEQCQGLVRRKWVDYRKDYLATRDPRIPVTPESIRSRTESRSQALKATLAESKHLADVIETAVDGLSRDRDNDLFGLPPKLDESTLAATAARDAANRMTQRLEGLSQEYADATIELDTLTTQVGAVQEQLADAWEAVSLGITAEALTHEVHQIADRLRARSQQMLRHLDDVNSNDLTIRSYVEHVRASAAALNRQMTHLNPALRYMRERRSRLQVSTVTRQVAAHFNENWADRNIAVKVEVSSDFYVEMNEGKLFQVLDNLILNSGYWIAERRRHEPDCPGTVLLGINSPFITVTDSGPGVDPSVEGLIFEPFVTTKGRGRGRGLGLFVVRQLLEPEAASITLDPAEHSDGRARTFRITFSNVERK